MNTQTKPLSQRLLIVIIPIVLVPEAMVAAIGQVYNFITTDMAWLYLLIGLVWQWAPSCF